MECFNSTLGHSARDAVICSSKPFRLRGQPTPSNSDLSKWRTTGNKTELAIIQAAGEVGKGNPEPEELAMTAELRADGYLWHTTSLNDVVCPGGLLSAAIMPYLTQGQITKGFAPIDDEGAAASIDSSPAMSAASSPQCAGGAKRGYQYTCAWCRASGHKAGGCPKLLAGHSAHPQARKSVRSKSSGDNYNAWECVQNRLQCHEPIHASNPFCVQTQPNDTVSLI